ncbi:MAG: membrane protein insertase YidC [Burkholderiales bacterium]|nr:membrane protein insertase YidC [Burkholderiales bacterium]MDE2396062.1 membrane protein insertase YidC [Burkholderiales bacterium]
MTDFRRTLLWVVFVTSLVLLWDGWQKANGHPSLFAGFGHPPAAAPASAAAGGTGVPAAMSQGVAAAPAAATLPSNAATPTGQTFEVSTDVVKATFDSLGGSLVRLELLKYRDELDHERDVVLFQRNGADDYVAETGLITSQPGVTLPTHLTPMTLAPGPRTLAPGVNELTLRFESAPIDGRQLIKTYTLKRGEYTIAVHHEVINNGATPIKPDLYLQLVRDGRPPPGQSSFYSTFTGPAMYTESSKYKKITFKDIAAGDDHDKKSDSGWIAMVQHYFASAWLVPTPGPREFRTAKIGPDLYSIAMVLPLGEIAPGASKSEDAILFAGPQEEKKLAALAPGLELVKDYGMLMPLAKPLFWLLTELHAFLGNWGWSIVSLVVILKAAFFWLNASAYKSMAKMKAINPRVMEMRERLKDKPQQMQQEMMRIYREEKVNPLGGCLPIVVQMPFFISLYWVLLSSVEMRGAPWIGWIHDLSVRDPYFILPLLMTGTSLIQVALGAKPPDPVQAKMMWIMPLAFSVMFFFFPAGLVMYWLTNNILSITQQWVINKRLGVSNR